MKKIYLYSSWLMGVAFILLLGVFGSQRERNNNPVPEISEASFNPGIAEAEHFIESSATNEVISQVSGGAYVRAETQGWLKIEIEIDTPGRYQSQIHYTSGTKKGTTCWIEDYCENEDNKIYNITGNMKVRDVSASGGMLTKDGTPLNAGLHRMKIHFDGPINIDRIKFKLIKPYQETRHIMKQKMDGNQWKVVWEDDFDHVGIDTSKWSFDIGDWGWGNNEIQYYTDHNSDNAYIENGNLIIEAKKDTIEEGWTSARLTTKNKVSFLFGKIEFRAIVPSARGNWAAGWTLGDAYIDELSGPGCGKIDILQSVGYEIDDATGQGLAHASAHRGTYYFKLGNQPTGVIEVDHMNNEYHTYSVIWTPVSIRAFVDDRHYITYDDNSTDLSWPFDKPQNLILNLAMGGGWGGNYGIDETIYSLKMIIDYVRVYELQ